MNLIKYILENDLGCIETNYSFSELTTIHTGGLIRYLYTPSDVSSLAVAFKYINDHNIKFLILGNGSNILASDNYFDGVVINMRKMPTYLDIYADYIDVSSSYSTSKLAYDLAKLELGDLSFLGGIPGTIGGAIYNNSGAFNKSIGDFVISVTYITKSGVVDTIDGVDIDFSYRNSIFHYYDVIIVSAKIKVSKVNTTEKLEEYLSIRRKTQPLDEYNMGSIFKNKKTIKAWEIIDLLRLRGFKVNGAKISEKHANFIINYNKSTSRDIVCLIELIKRRALNELGIELETEVTII